MSHIPFTTIPSTNHASPTGSLPFLLPCSPSASKSTTAPKEDAPPFPIPTTKLQKWARDQPAPASVPDEPETERYEPYLALLDHNIRNAWGSVPTTDRVLRRPIQLHTLYLSPLNAHLPASLYITPSTTFPPLRTHLSQSLATAAESALHTHLGPIVDIEALYRDAELALDALETLLQTRGGKGNDTENTGQAPWFFSSPHPTYFDAAVFAYTHLLLDEGMGWRDTRLVSAVRKKTGLVKHRERVLRLCYPDLTYKGLQDRLEGPSM
ncbi:MAG: hypothetical protein M1819_002600 [Sarea resinae]|nr:MAG: hypothetical protein M1819_002600 [Sarea resinae]